MDADTVLRQEELMLRAINWSLNVYVQYIPLILDFIMIQNNPVLLHNL